VHPRHDAAQRVKRLVCVVNEFWLFSRFGPMRVEHQSVFQGVRQRKTQILLTQGMHLNFWVWVV
jgi:hypothetical protein